MLHIDQNIFEEISRYEEGKLEGAEREAVARKLQNDEAWRNHRDYYQTVVRAIGRATLATEIERMQRQTPSAKDIAAVDALLDKDRRSANLRRTIYRVALLLLVAGIGFWLGRVTAPPPPPPPPVVVAEVPIAEAGEDEAEAPLSAPGNDHSLKVDFNEASQRQIFWQPHDGSQIESVFLNDHLKLFVPKGMEAQFQSASLAWSAREMNGATKHFLKINDQYFSLTPGGGRQPLMPVTDGEVLKMLK